MPFGRRFRRAATALAAVGLLAGPAAVLVPAAAATCWNWTGIQPPNNGPYDNILLNATMTGPCHAWAVGYYSLWAVGD